VTKQDWKNSAELIGVLAIVASLVFVGLQMRQAQEIAYSELDVSLLAIHADTADLITANSEVWVKGSVGDELSVPETAVFTELVKLLNGRWFVEYRHANSLGRADIAETILHDWSAFLYQNPGARRAWKSREENLHRFREMLVPGGDQFSFWRELINADLARLDSLKE